MIDFEAHCEVVVNSNHTRDVAKLKAHDLAGKSLTEVVGYKERQSYVGGRIEDEVACFIHLVNGQLESEGHGQHYWVKPSGPLQVP